jgi:penicillin-binding protein 2
MFGGEEVVKSHNARANEIAFIVIICMGILFGRIFYLQIIKGDLLFEYSVKNRLREEVVWAPRGKIFDREGTLVVDNRPRFDAVLVRQYFLDEKATLEASSKILDIPIESLEKISKKYITLPSYRPIILKKNISFTELAKIETQSDKLPGVSVQVSIAREYINEEIGAHVLGYISEISSEQLPRYRKRDDIDYRLGDFIGQSGIEKRFDQKIRGINGREYVQVDALGRKRKYVDKDNLFQAIRDIDSIPGDSVALTIDWELQKKAYDVLKGQSGAIVALDVHTGEILTMVSTPSFRPSEFNQGIDAGYWKELIENTDRPLRDKAIQEHYSPGSTFKVVTAIVGLAQKIVTPRTEMFCSGGLKFGKRTYHCWKKGGHGTVNMVKAIKESCNYYFQKIALNTEIDVLAEYARLLGFGTKTGVQLPRETSGLIPDKEWKLKRRGIEWQKGETLSCAIGQSYILSTPLQLANAYAALVNGGKVYRPQIIKKFFNAKENTTNEMRAEIISEINIPKEISDTIVKGLYYVVNQPGGTAYRQFDPGTQLAGKTGTSQVFTAKASEIYKKCEDLPEAKRHHGLFAGFAPANNPRIALAAIIEHGCHGSTTAAPLVQEIATAYMKKYFPEEYKANKEQKHRGIVSEN